MQGTGANRWLLIALLVLIFLLALWVLAAMQLDPAAAGSRISLSLRSRLAANYGPDQSGPLGSLHLSIVGDFFEDLGLAPSEASAASDAVRIGLLGPVPTATALNFQGTPPPTLTPLPTATATNTPTDTPVPTATFTPVPPTETPTEEPTDKPKKKPTAAPTKTPTDEPTAAPTATPTNTPVSSADTQKPQLLGSPILSLPSGESISCVQEVSVSEIHIYDPEHSEGIDDGDDDPTGYVKLKYKIEGPGTEGYIRSDQLDRTGGGFEGDPPPWIWDAHYEGGMTISFEDGYHVMNLGVHLLAKPLADEEEPEATATPEPPTATPEPPTATAEPPTPTFTPEPSPTPTVEPFEVNLYVIASDDAGKLMHEHLATYWMDGSCAE